MAQRQDVVFRGTKGGLQLILNDSQNFDTIVEKLKDHLKRAELFFQGADVVLDTGKLDLSIDQILEIQNILAFPHGLRLKRIIHGDQEPPRNMRPRAEDVEKSQRTLKREARNIEYRQRPVKNQGKPVIWPETLLYKGTLRSGQRITYEGNVVVVGDVNPGAEISATGDIVVMGNLRGLAHAGAGGAAGVVVVAFKLEPTQLRIGDVIGRPPEDDLGTPKEPEVARLKDGMILVEPLDGSRWEGDR
ncbi:MAG TPA: septum site-determining protein MinC [Firmicutes bacterium]|jgi:septum site-determining protein MinC|nr:septum site-determining protein MinC [Bacillota bacterium]